LKLLFFTATLANAFPFGHAREAAVVGKVGVAVAIDLEVVVVVIILEVVVASGVITVFLCSGLYQDFPWRAWFRSLCDGLRLRLRLNSGPLCSTECTACEARCVGRCRRRN